MIQHYRTVDTIDGLLQQIKDAAADGDYIFRGENMHHSKIASTLYRQYEETESEYFDIALVQQEILNEAKQYAPPDKTNGQILTEIQHYGGATNLIDFTGDYLIALFFACDGAPNADGRIILLDQTIISKNLNQIIPPSIENNRVLLQKSIFVSPKRGYLLDSEVRIISVANELKSGMLDHLKRCHNIHNATIYKDILGYIQAQKADKNFFAGLQLKIAEDRFNEAIKLNKNDATAYYNLGYAYSASKEYEKAIENYSMAIEINPNYEAAYYNRGGAYSALGNYEEAIKDYGKAIEIMPNNAPAYYNRGCAYSDLGIYKEAIVDFSMAINIEPEKAHAYFNRASTYARLGKHEDAMNDYDMVLQIQPDNSGAHHNRKLSVAKLEKQRSNQETPK